MAFDTNALAEVYDNIRFLARDIKSRSQSLRNASAGGPVDSERILDWFRNVVGNRAAIAAQANTPGLAAYAKNESNNLLYDVTAEYNAMLAQIDSCLEWVTTNFPKDGSGWLLSHSIVSNVVTPRTFSTAALATFRTVLDSLIATIN